MASLTAISNGMFDPQSDVTVRIVMSADIVFRKNHNFGKQALSKSKFAKYISDLCACLEKEEACQILGTLESHDVQYITDNFTQTNCKYHINYHDQKMCTVEFVAKYETTVEKLLNLSEELISEMHLEIKTPVGDVQV